ncbi:TPA: BolA/IbaG family iron-sulfur metabolism protein [Legionella pneumophila]|nr:BolA/IbaG family iron-sulfur metabolism protein [Legionella pneumophila]HAU1321970.1 BolA/IbaG family iron-sulfur metabolism protein [Legionella pneumophila]HBC0466998.1 BolA/IbaG family iron-sulfur metabolism protein [Legionella pneumophila]HBD9375035.1 BolA/IbaG family iron-sulfur metabolism protein [Legionella pneumophila]HBI2947602.1 BolA/IbaG family iron-sulfur metabolism protein [Legionella pneumophila]
MSRKQRIEEKLIPALSPLFLSVENESMNHHVPPGAETHFKVIAVSNHFNDLTRINRHKLVNQLLKDEFTLGLHALSMHLYTADEWTSQQQSVLKSPACRDGYKNK